MKPQIIEIRKQDNRLTEVTRQHLKQAFDNLKDGTHEVHLFANMERAYKTRYKWYFAYLLPEIITRCNILITCHQTGEERHITTGELHQHFKKAYNGGSVVDPLTGKISLVGLSTTKLDDNEFISEFEDKIQFDFMTAFPDAFQDFLDRGTWIDAMKAKYELRDKIDSK